jgi:glycolate oxidase
LRESVEEQVEQIREVCALCRAREFRVARSVEERDLLWKGRKNAFGAVGRVSPTYYVQDGVVPRTQIAPTLRLINLVGEKYGLTISNIFHAGDGNMHPIILFDPRKPGDLDKAKQAGEDILLHCISVGGSITGEHGVGEDKKKMMSKMYSEPDLETMQRVRCAFDPLQLSNPSKMFPRPRLCGEKPGEYVAHPLETAGIAERF